MSSESKYLNDQYKSFFEDSLSKTDPDLYKAINDELQRQQEHIELIALYKSGSVLDKLSSKKLLYWSFKYLLSLDIIKFF